MQPCNPIGYVHSLESFGSVDGPGVRFVVFLQGCALRCKYCHNPETWAEGGEEWTVDKLFQRVWRYRNYWGKKGGITVSGGEPLRQMEFLTAFFELARSKGVHTALDTAGQPFRPDDPDYLAGFDRLMKSTSLVILDLKEIDPERHRQLTGKDNANILAMARRVSDLGVPLWIRHVLVPGLTEAMVRFAVRFEYARTVEDMLARRSRLLFLDARKAAEIAPRVAAILTEELGQDVHLDDFLALTRQYLPAQG